MLDLKFIRENPELVKQGIKNKNEKDRVDEVLELDEERRNLIIQTDELKHKRNLASSQIPQMKKSGQDVSSVLAEMKSVSDKISDLDSQLNNVEGKLNDILMFIPNMPHSSVPVGKSSEENVEVRKWQPGEFSFEQNEKVLDHIELGKKNNILDFERGAKISGSGFPLYLGKGATLERALINFMLDYHINNHGYSEVFPPFLVNRDSMKGTGQLPKMEEDMYFIDKDDLFPIPTAEVPITNIFRK
jgi:seryl-tRNA synthetase